MAGNGWHTKLAPDQRCDRASEIVSRAIDQLQEIIGVAETNRIIVYSPAVASQIPVSHAANAFNLLQWITLNYEIVRLCALWDKGSTDRESILAICDLLDDPVVVSLVSERLCQSEGVSQPNDYVRRALTRLEKAIRVTKRVSQSKFRQALLRFRDARVAHSLTQSPNAVSIPLKYGYERRLLTASVAIVAAFNGALRNSTFLFGESFANARRNSEAFWHSALFSVKD